VAKYPMDLKNMKNLYDAIDVIGVSGESGLVCFSRPSGLPGCSALPFTLQRWAHPKPRLE